MRLVPGLFSHRKPYHWRHCRHEETRDELIPWSESGGSFDWWQRVCVQCGAVVAFADVRPGIEPEAR